MRNIELTVSNSIELFTPQTEGNHRLPQKCHASVVSCIDPATGRSFIVSNTGHLTCSRPSGNGQHIVCASLELHRLQVGGGSLNTCDFIQLLNLAWLEEESTLFAVFRTGELCGFTIASDFSSSGDAVIIQTIFEGIACAAWSPDLEQLALVTQDTATDDAKLLLIARGLTFHVLNETSLDTTHLGEKQFITVGWGRKETQFHGKAGKDARKAVLTKDGSAGIDAVENVLTLPVISWREDCNYFAVSSVSHLENSYNQRVIRVYDRNAVLQYTSEHVPPSIGSALAWRPSGNLIAASYTAPATPATTRAPDCVDNLPTAVPWQIIFFEKNGLRHGEFSLGDMYTPSSCEVRSLLWNADSSVLAVVVEFPSKDRTVIMLWTMMNYHWYLKLTMPLKSGTRLMQIMFDPINALQLHLIVTGPYLHTINFRRTVCCSIADNELLSHAAVIDGHRVLITCFGEQAGAAVIPPPMCSYSITFAQNLNSTSDDDELPVSVNACCFQKMSAQLDLIITTSDCKRHVFLCPPFVNFDKDPETAAKDEQQLMFESCVRITREQATSHVPLMKHLHTFSCSAEPTNSAAATDSAVGGCALSESNALMIIIKAGDVAKETNLFDWSNNEAKYWFDDETREHFHIVGSGLIETESSVVLHLTSAVQQADPSQAEDYGVNIADTDVDFQTVFRRLMLSPETVGKSENILRLQNRNVDSFKLLNRATKTMIIISHSSANNRLYADAEQIADDCTSYCIHPSFLIYTTHRDELKCIPHAAVERFVTTRHTRRAENDTIGTELMRFATFSRVCEKGASIVTCSATQVVLQMPRGNLEAVYPRSLVLHRVFRLLSNDKSTPFYAEAYQLSRRHRVNSNILYDFDADKFRKNIDEFIDQFLLIMSSSPRLSDYLELFITDFDVQDTTQGEYKDYVKELMVTERQAVPVTTDSGEKDFQGLLKLLQQRLHARLGSVSTTDNERRLLFKPILATYAKLCLFEEALMCCKQWRSTYAGEKSVFSLDEALKFLMYWVHDINQLFDYALSTYDFEIALLVGQKSTRDPREFVPLLRQFRTLSPLKYQHYAIDRHLRNYKKALANLIECIFELATLPATNDATYQQQNAEHQSTTAIALTLPEAVKILSQLVNEQKLYVPAISQLLRRKSLVDKNSTINETLNSIRCSYAEYLHSVLQKFDEAACQYYHAKAYERACQMYQKCANWQMALVCKSAAASSGEGDSSGGGGDADSLAALAKKAVRQLTLARRFDEARSVAIAWLNDYDLGLQTCIDGSLWSDAREILYQPRILRLDQNLQNEKKSALKFAVKQQAELMREDVADWLKKFTEYFDRLQTVRKLRPTRALSGHSSELVGDETAMDDAASTITSSTASSRMSSVSRHKSREDRKKRSLKRGGRYEHVALMEALRNEVYTPAFALEDAVIRVLDALAVCETDADEANIPSELGTLLQNDYNGLVQHLAARASAIWRPEEQLNEVFQLNACVQPQSQPFPGNNNNLTLVSAVLNNAPGRIDKATSEVLYVDGMSADDVTLFLPPKIDLLKWNNHMLMWFKIQ